MSSTSEPIAIDSVVNDDSGSKELELLTVDGKIYL